MLFFAVGVVKIWCSWFVVLVCSKLCVCVGVQDKVVRLCLCSRLCVCFSVERCLCVSLFKRVRFYDSKDRDRQGYR